MRNLVFMAAAILIFVFLIVSIFKKVTRKVIRIIGAMVLIAAAVFWWFHPAWQYPQTTGPYPVGTVTVTYTDDARPESYEKDGSSRWLNVAYWYPSGYTGDSHTCPLVVFSHGSFGIKESNETLFRELASHGYVVCSIDHTYQCLGTPDPNGKKVGMDRTYMKQILSASDKTAESRTALAGLFSEWMTIRMGDIGFVLDTIKAAAAADDNGADGVYRLADTANIGVMGHSLGGAAALGIGRVRSDIKAVIALEAPFMYDVKGCVDGQFVWDDTIYPVPLLSVYTDSSWDILKASPQYAQNNAVLKDNSDTTYDVFVKGAGHMTLTDLGYSAPPLCLLFGQRLLLDAGQTSERLNQPYLDFFDCYLRGSGAYHPISFE